MTKTAKLFTNGGSQAIRLPKEFRFPGKEVRIRKTKNGISITPIDDEKEKRRQAFIALAGSCPDFPDIPPHTAPDLPRDLDW
ncbi:antitoxin [Actomonas aquatica]|uniref:AbrB/MazE/SpoVT family DNA-binding domain-containing protein n=1 Tax=Actomonas aquatica TaxID=2866162 RepID=A0ABZ1CFC3_9BACT|nr:AbrB/MazE/SpoVT family DNA-binding domain-containing protein [Opitutus sp. WL0086]WRQ90050.1 AbrB/MazE/SpoVT family DNA-binding domain-containing protein [Opitutus sp. WL0086]